MVSVQNVSISLMTFYLPMVHLAGDIQYICRGVYIKAGGMLYIVTLFVHCVCFDQLLKQTRGEKVWSSRRAVYRKRYEIYIYKSETCFFAFFLSYTTSDK